MRKLDHLEIPRLSDSDYQQSPKHGITVILENVRSAYNVGSIFRTSDAARIERIILGGFTADPSNKAVRKTALGAEEVVEWRRTDDLLATIADLRSKGYSVAAIEIVDDSREPWDVQASDFPLCLVLGNEVTGISQEVIDLADFCIEIPQFGTKQSLNVSVAYGIVAMELVRTSRTIG